MGVAFSVDQVVGNAEYIDNEERNLVFVDMGATATRISILEFQKEEKKGLFFFDKISIAFSTKEID